jgi:hypothetical protein
MMDQPQLIMDPIRVPRASVQMAGIGILTMNLSSRSKSGESFLEREGIELEALAWT